MNRQTLQAFNTDAIKALEKVAAEHGMSIRAGRSSFREENANIKFDLSDIAADGEILTPEAQAFKLNAGRYGLSPDDLYGTFNLHGKQYRITGLKTQRPKFPISGVNVKTGQKHKFTEAHFETTTITRKGTGRRAAISAQKGELTSDIKQQFISLASQLSPENLSCDGELSAAETRRAAVRLNRRWNALEKEIGRKVSESEAFGFLT